MIKSRFVISVPKVMVGRVSTEFNSFNFYFSVAGYSFFS